MLPLIVPVVLLLRVVRWSGIKALIQIRHELLVPLKSSLGVRALEELLPWVTTWLRRRFKHTSNFIKVCEQKRIIWAVVVYNAIKLRPSHLALGTHNLKLILDGSVASLNRLA